MELWAVALFIIAVFLGLVVLLLVYLAVKLPDVARLQANGDVDGLIKALRYDHSNEADEIRGKAALALGELRAFQALGPLINALKDKNPYVCRTAAIALGQLRDPRAAVPLALVLHKPVEKQAAIRSLKQIDGLALQYLDAASKHPSSEMRQAAITAMGEIGEPWTIQSLIIALEHEDEATQTAAAQALLKIGQPAANSIASLTQHNDPAVRRLAVETLTKVGGESQTETLKIVLKDGDSRIRKAAARTLTRFNWQPETDQEYVDYWIATEQWEKCVEVGAVAAKSLTAVLESKDDGSLGATQQAAAESLQKIGAPAVDSLLTLLDNKDDAVSQIAVVVLGEIGHPQAIPPLIEALHKENDSLRQTIVISLDKLNWQPDKSTGAAIYWITKQNWQKCVEVGEPAVDSLLKIVKDENTPPDISQAVIQVLEKIESPKASEMLVDHWMAEGEWEKAAELGHAAVKPLTAAINMPDERLKAIDALGKIGDVQAIEPLMDSLTDKRWIVRDKVVRALTKIGSPAVNHLVAIAINNNGKRDNQERQVAIEALGQIGNTKAVTPLMNIFRKSSNTNNQTRKTAARALGQIGDKKAINLLIGMVNNPEERRDVRQVSIIALGEIGDDKALGPIINVLSDWKEYGSLRETAAEALADIGHIYAVEPLIKALQNKGQSVRQASAAALVEITGEDFGTNEFQWRQWWNSQKTRAYSKFNRYKLKDR